MVGGWGWRPRPTSWPESASRISILVADVDESTPATSGILWLPLDSDYRSSTQPRSVSTVFTGSAPTGVIVNVVTPASLKAASRSFT